MVPGYQPVFALQLAVKEGLKSLENKLALPTASHFGDLRHTPVSAPFAGLLYLRAGVFLSLDPWEVFATINFQCRTKQSNGELKR